MNHTVKTIIDLLQLDAFRETFLKELNEEIDLPFVSEKKERKFFKRIYKTFLASFRKLEQELE